MSRLTQFNLLALFLFFNAMTLTAQDAIIRGEVIDGDLGEKLFGATVSIYEPGSTALLTGTTTDLDGAYSIDVKSGPYQVIISYISYAADTLNLETVGGEVSFNQTVLYPEGTVLEEIVVTAQASQTSDVAINLAKQKSLNAIDGISLDQIKRTGDSDLGGALTRVTGVSVQDGKYVNIRGLGDRYSKTVLNGGDIPALDPDRNTVQLDIFPSNLIDNIIVYKNFTPDLPGDFTGGLVDIQTKSHPDDFQLNFSASFGYNPTANLRDDFLSYELGDYDWLGFDDGGRAKPGFVEDLENGVTITDEKGEARFFDMIPTLPGRGTSTTTDSLEASLIDQAVRSFPEYYTIEEKRSGINQNYQLSFGNQFDLWNRPFGYIFGLSYRNTYQVYEGYEFNRSRAQESLDSLVSDQVYSTSNLTEDRVADRVTQQEALWGAILGLSYKLDDRSKLSFNYMHNQSGQSRTTSLLGRDLQRETIGNFPVDVYDEAMFFSERSLDAFQLSGDHLFGQLSVDWIGSYSISSDEQPDFRLWTVEGNNQEIIEVISIEPLIFEADTVYRYGFSSAESNFPGRFYRTLEETNQDFKLNLSVPINVWGGRSAKLKFGGAYTYKERDFSEDQYVYQFNRDYLADPDRPFLTSGDGADLVDPNEVGIDTVVDFGASRQYQFNVLIEEQSREENSYTADQSVLAGYAMIELPITSNLRFIGGARYETTEMNVETPVDDDRFRGSIDVQDVLPSANMIYAINPKINLRGGYSKTLARPSFREFAPFFSFGFNNGFGFTGNPNLERTLIDNFDLRFEWFPTQGELFSISGFYKTIENPIEKRFESGVDNARNLVIDNNESAEVYGFEVEVKKHFGFIGAGWKRLQFNGNFTLLESVVDLDSLTREFSQNILGVTDRPLFGQPDYTFNAELAFVDNLNLGLRASLSYSIFGQRLALVGQRNFNAYEQPRGLLNFSVRKQIGKYWAVQFRANNLLDPDYLISYKFNPDDDFDADVQENYRLGRTYSIGFSFSL